jgi:hypothetical protein
VVLAAGQSAEVLGHFAEFSLVRLVGNRLGWIAEPPRQR